MAEFGGAGVIGDGIGGIGGLGSEPIHSERNTVSSSLVHSSSSEAQTATLAWTSN